MDAEGNDQTRLTNHPELDAFPEWSPDGEHIAFRSDRAGNLEVFIMAANGESLFNWTNHPASDCHPRWTGSVVTVGLRRSAVSTRAPKLAASRAAASAGVGPCAGE
jgi:hypothetical protein